MFNSMASVIRPKLANPAPNTAMVLMTALAVSSASCLMESVTKGSIPTPEPAKNTPLLVHSTIIPVRNF